MKKARNAAKPLDESMSFMPKDRLARAILGFARYPASQVKTTTWLEILGHLKGVIASEIEYLSYGKGLKEHLERYYPWHQIGSSSEMVKYDKCIVLRSPNQQKIGIPAGARHLLIVATSKTWTVIDMNTLGYRYEMDDLQAEQEFRHDLERDRLIAPLIIKRIMYLCNEADNFYRNIAAGIKRKGDIAEQISRHVII